MQIVDPSALSEDKRHNAFRPGGVLGIVRVLRKKHALLGVNAYPGAHADKQGHGQRQDRQVSQAARPGEEANARIDRVTDEPIGSIRNKPTLRWVCGRVEAAPAERHARPDH